jgi:nucleotide-binding universal stress UspA family protein
LSVEVLAIAPFAEVRRIADEVVEAVEERDGALLVMGTALVSDPRRSVTGRVVEALRQPVLLFGPNVPSAALCHAPTLVVGLAVDPRPRPGMSVVEAWQRTFGGPQPWLVDVIATAAWPSGSIENRWEMERVGAAAAELAERGVEASTTVLRALDAVDALNELAAGLAEPVFVITSDRSAAGSSHWYSTARRLLRESRHPVLLVPSDLPVA